MIILKKSKKEGITSEISIVWHPTIENRVTRINDVA